MHILLLICFHRHVFYIIRRHHNKLNKYKDYYIILFQFCFDKTTELFFFRFESKRLCDLHMAFEGFSMKD